jgi:G3E family GTPase
LVEVAALAKSGRFDQLLIESTGISEPLPVAETFTFEIGSVVATGDAGDVSSEEASIPASLRDIARLDSMVTVVDGVNFLRDLTRSGRGDATLAELGHGNDEDDERSLAGLLMAQVLFCLATFSSTPTHNIVSCAISNVLCSFLFPG